MLQYSQDEIIGLSLKELHPTDVYEDKILLNFYDCNEEKKRNEKNLPYLRKDKTILHADVDEETICLNGIICNIGFIKQVEKNISTEKEIKQSETRFKQFFECSPDYCYMILSGGEILNINQTALNVLGMEKNEIIGLQIIPTVYPESEHKRAKEHVKKWLKQGYLRNEEIKIKTKEGERTVLISVEDVRNQEGKLLYSILMQKDIQDLKDSENQLYELNKKLDQKVKKRTNEVEKLLKQKDEFIHLLSHDLKNPLIAPLTLLPIVKNKTNDENDKKILDTVEHSCKVIRSIVDDTLKLARLDNIDKGIMKESINLRSLINQVIENNEQLLNKYQFSVENTVNEDLHIKVDEFLFREVISNILSNSIKYTPEDHEQKAIFSVQDTKEFTQLSIKDFGRGLDEDHIQSLFDSFSKDAQPRNGFDSTGLGLSLCKGIIERHGGTIWAESQGLGKGSTFYIKIPK